MPGVEDSHALSNPLVADVHDRMPAILKPEDYEL
jgi:putative SOS response-associated peptidase YedK